MSMKSTIIFELITIPKLIIISLWDTLEKRLEPDHLNTNLSWKTRNNTISQ